MSKEKPEIFVGLDLGTTKICAIVAQVNGTGINILGIGNHPSTGLRRGIVVDMNKTTDCIASAVEDAERKSGEDIRSVFVGIAGGHVKSHNFSANVRIAGDCVSDKDIKRLIESATATNVSADRELINATPGRYSIDGQQSVVNPLGMQGKTIETQVHVVTAQVADTNNLIGCVRGAGLDVNGIVLEQIASGEAVLSETEKELGVVLVDCGGGTTDIALFSGGDLKYTQNITLGGDHVDRDISHRFSISSDLESRKIKERHGVALCEMASDEKDIEIPLSDRTTVNVSQREIAEVIEPRMKEMLTIARDEIPDSFKIDEPTSKVVLTGGSLAMKGAVEMAESVFDMPAKLGLPGGIDSSSEAVFNPAYSTGVGLIHYGVKYSGNTDKIGIRSKNTFEKIRSVMVKWFELF